jgi:hypothetical protein
MVTALRMCCTRAALVSPSSLDKHFKASIINMLMMVLLVK